MPIRNWQGEWHERLEAGPHMYEHGLWVRVFWSRCWGCVQHCYKTAVVVEPGKHERLVSELPDYENQATHGSIADIWDPDEICKNTTLANELGFDTIGIGNTVAFAFELYEKGILTREDTGGLELKWGDANAWRAFHEMIAARKGIGAVFAEGQYRAALEIARRKNLPPEKVLYYAIQCKGIEWGAHGIRSTLDYTRWTITYAVSVQGGDHTSIASPRLEDYERGPIINDTAMFCWFTAPPIGQAAQWLTAVTGWSYSVDTLNTIALRTIMIQRAALLLGGPDVRWYDEATGRAIDENPGRIREEPLPSGPVKGRKVDPATFQAELKTYYETHGYDEKGIPKSEVLLALGLKDVDDALKKLRK
ncbi:MAG: aldehyde ferredoxin oxidoreductase C-terminal domain-containing protein [Thermofilum sp.]